MFLADSFRRKAEGGVLAALGEENEAALEELDRVIQSLAPAPALQIDRQTSRIGRSFSRASFSRAASRLERPAPAQPIYLPRSVFSERILVEGSVIEVLDGRYVSVDERAGGGRELKSVLAAAEGGGARERIESEIRDAIRPVRGGAVEGEGTGKGRGFLGAFASLLRPKRGRAVEGSAHDEIANILAQERALQPQIEKRIKAIKRMESDAGATPGAWAGVRRQATELSEMREAEWDRLAFESTSRASEVRPGWGGGTVAHEVDGKGWKELVGGGV